jgi:hypothetical protein
MKSRILIIILIFCAQFAVAQNGGYYKNWIITNNTLATFNAVDTPSLSIVGDTIFRTRFHFNASMNYSFYNVSTISSPITGKYLFYFFSDGKVIDSSFMPMPNTIGPNSLGTINTSNPSFNYGSEIYSNGSLVVPISSNLNQFLLFTLQPSVTTAPSGYYGVSYNLFYHLIDMSLNNGKGDVVASQKNILLKSGLWGGPLNAVRNPQNNHFWLICHDTTSTYFAFDIDANGQLNTTPVSSTVGNHLPQNIDPNSIGILKSNCLGTQLALGFHNGQDTVINVNGTITYKRHNHLLEICNFNKQNGTITFNKSFSFPSIFHQFEFSPSGNFLYAFDSNQLVQINILNSIRTPIRNYPVYWNNPNTIGQNYSAGNWHSIPSFGLSAKNYMQLAENGKIYFWDTSIYKKFISGGYTNIIDLNKIHNQSCIENPDVAFPGCNVKDSIFFGLATDTLLPNSNWNYQSSYPNIINS